ncbi:chitinase 2-like [Vicia villosa]|uniref:chitinase 2-like n=1 Tax=Vicia villosa TaxID=3911 RepID=UPI00273A8301|nr:chitinase 2-like [Vicia villosa]
MSSSAIVKPIIYREYVLKHFPTTVNPEYNPVDFIIGFASEDYYSNGKGTGHFHPTWDPATFSPKKMKELKEKYPQVRWVISIGSAVGTDYPFNPHEKHVWIATAVKSIKDIIHTYDVYDDGNHKNIIDGIDIHYEAIKSSPEDFSFCIGQVIKKLKNDPHLSIKVVSIAPTKDTQSHYQKLYFENQDYIDIVDYLFTNLHSIEDFVKIYQKLIADYNPALVLPGYLNPPFRHDRTKEFIMYLVKHKSAPGFFTYPSHDYLDPGPLSI